MDTTRKKKLMVRWAIFTALVTFIFWAIWHSVTGQVPVVRDIEIIENKTLELPFGISRYLDVIIAPIWSIIIIWILTNKKVREKVLGIGLTFGLIFGVFLRMVAEYSLFALLLCLVSNLLFVILFGTPFGLAFGLSFGLTYGLSKGLVFGLIYLTLLVAFVGLIYVLKRTVGWLMAIPKKSVES